MTHNERKYSAKSHSQHCPHSFKHCCLRLKIQKQSQLKTGHQLCWYYSTATTVLGGEQLHFIATQHVLVKAKWLNGKHNCRCCLIVGSVYLLWMYRLLCFRHNTLYLFWFTWNVKAWDLAKFNQFSTASSTAETSSTCHSAAMTTWSDTWKTDNYRNPDIINKYNSN